MTTTNRKKSVLVVGSGITGVATSVELASLGWQVTLIDRPVETSDGVASDDVSKLLRAEYGSQAAYSDLVVRAWTKKRGGHGGVPGWLAMNAFFDDPTLVHPSGFLMLSKGKALGPFEQDSFQTVARLGLPASVITELPGPFAANSAGWNCALHDRFGGWARSGAVVDRLLLFARGLGVHIVRGTVSRLLFNDNDGAGGGRPGRRRCVGVELLDSGRQTIVADETVVACGAWTPFLVPDLKRVLWPTAQFVAHFKTTDNAWSQVPGFSLDISQTGMYGFPAHPITGLVKVGTHSIGYPFGGPTQRNHYVLPTRERLEQLKARVDQEERARVQRFVRASGLTSLNRIVETRLCLYCDSVDGHFLVDRHPNIDGLTVAAGGAGHLFKFAPLIGEWVALRLENRPLQQPLDRLFAFRGPDHQQQTARSYADQARSSSSPTTNASSYEFDRQNLFVSSLFKNRL